MCIRLNMLQITYISIMLLRLVTLIKLIIFYSIHKTGIPKYLETLSRLYF
jgi:hypothetical protein